MTSNGFAGATRRPRLRESAGHGRLPRCAVVELSGIEPLTSAVRLRGTGTAAEARAPECRETDEERGANESGFAIPCDTSDASLEDPEWHVAEAEAGHWLVKPIPGQIIADVYDEAAAYKMAAAPDLYEALTHALGLIVEFGNMNGFRNLSDAELGKCVTGVAREAAAALAKTRP